MRLLPAVLLIVFLAGVSGCAPAAAGQAAVVNSDRVDMPPSYRFDPPAIRVAVGTTVTWTNHDNFTHDVHLLGGLDWRSQSVRSGESVSYTFTKVGEYPYVCDFHEHDMRGTVTVTAR